MKRLLNNPTSEKFKGILQSVRDSKPKESEDRKETNEADWKKKEEANKKKEKYSCSSSDSESDFDYEEFNCIYNLLKKLSRKRLKKKKRKRKRY